ncbi:hypothetical protein LWC34_08300 [Kibdelosporangium philippinense]|uniref:Uncharacterized protein n=1 Tax=Kibdelosporangium philippinense TaxID=211113 RepID=A0ABS8Z7R0_9PSEU|nr:hypothetical protein [Kibdelosporangium philippinense]MCE7002830.1 hypothetical protein [Kibdelosporangium philippinense]
MAVLPVLLGVLAMVVLRWLKPPGFELFAVFRTGGPVDVHAAPAVIHHAQWRLRRMDPARRATIIGTVPALLLLAAIAHIAIGEPASGMWFLSIDALPACLIPAIARDIKYRKNAERVHWHAVHVLGVPQWR